MMNSFPMIPQTITQSLPRLSDDRGATVVEYAILAALIAGVIIGTVSLLGQEVLAMFGNPDLVDALS